MNTYSYLVSECGNYVYRVNNSTQERETIKEPEVVETTPPLFPVLDIDPSLRRGRKRPKQIISDPVKIEKPKKQKPKLLKVDIDPTVRRGRGKRPRPNVEPFVKRSNKPIKISNKPKKHRILSKTQIQKQISKTTYTGKKYKGVVLTYLTGGYDDLPKLNKTQGWDYICVTDATIRNKDWKVFPLLNEDKDVIGKKKQASSIMFNAINYLKKQYDVLITMDANIFINDDLNKIVDNYKILENDVTFLKHPDRTCVYQEIETLSRLTSKDKKENTLKALEFLESENYPKDLGLFATGAIFMNPNSEILKAYLENARADYIKSPSIRDQVTINYSIWKSNKTLPSLSYKTINFDDLLAYSYKNKNTPFIIHAHNKNRKKKRVFKNKKIVKKTLVKIFENTPYNNEKDLVKAYNDFMEIIPDDSWALFRDADTLFLDSFYNQLFEEAILQNPNTGCFTAVTNRINCADQLHYEYKGDDISIHRDIAIKLREKYGSSCKSFTGHDKLSGFCILLKKSVWKEINGFKPYNSKSNILGVDNQLHIDLINNNHDIKIIQGLYMYHWYRGGTKNKEHLE